MAIASAQKLSDENLENVSGGAIFYAGDIAGHNPEAPWEVINDSGHDVNGKGQGAVLGQFSTPGDAADAARRLGLNDQEIGWNRVRELRS